jgi:hypothetical protein
MFRYTGLHHYYSRLKENKLIIKGPLLNGLYQTKLSEFIPSINNLSYAAVHTTVRQSMNRSRGQGVFKNQPKIQTAEDIELLHQRVGNTNVTNILQGLNTGTVSGYDVTAKRLKNK